MSLEAIISKAKKLSDLGGFSASPPDTGKQFRKWSREPVPDFIERLPEVVMNPATGEAVSISQSKMKEFLRVIDQELCGKRFYQTRITEEYEDEAGDAAKLGCRFEFLAIGSPGRRGEGVEPIMTSRGPSTADKRAVINAKKCSEVVADMSRKAKAVETQRKITVKCLEGTLDLFGHHWTQKELEAVVDGEQARTYSGVPLVVDIKYTGLLDNDREAWGWPKDIRNKESHIIQAKHYSLLCEIETGIRPDFYFLVFSNKSHKLKGEEIFGVYRPYLVKISDEAMNEHKNMILDLIEQLQERLDGKDWTARPSYSHCQSCPIFECKSRAKEPETIITEL